MTHAGDEPVVHIQATEKANNQIGVSLDDFRENRCVDFRWQLGRRECLTSHFKIVRKTRLHKHAYHFSASSRIDVVASNNEYLLLSRPAQEVLAGIFKGALGLLPGVLREQLISEGRAREAALTLDDLAGGFWIGNALRGLMRAVLV
jgi:hypothetical protein